ncbi:HU family DNA-binding protein [Azospirillum himalayense]|uniref:HU family DNA-binding protein n=1 Tax=Azospirillum himalayense TaxID=654847 RepID=A0ABW0GCZ2_9PROT
MSTRSKKDVIDTIAEKSDVTKKAAGEALDMVLGAIGAELKDGHDVQLHGFGNFTVKHTEERPGRNPRTGEAVTVRAKTKVSFKQAKALLEG